MRGRTLPAPPHVYASPAPQHKPAPPPVHLTVVKPDNSGLGHGAKARAARHDVLTPGQRALAGVATRHVHGRRCYPGGYVYEGASQRLEPFPQPAELRSQVADLSYYLRSSSPTRQKRPSAPSPPPHAAPRPHPHAAASAATPKALMPALSGRAGVAAARGLQMGLPSPRSIAG